ncbi:MAG: serpin family protein [Ginsengibacter sp.]
MKKILAFIYICSLVIFASCNKPNPYEPDETKTIVLPVDGSAIINANNKFAFDFFNAALKQDSENNNKLISPLSIYLALSMAYNGANNSTKDSISKALQLSGIDINSLNELCHTLISMLPQEDNKVKLSIANSIWYKQNTYQPIPSFLDAVHVNYDASVNPLNFDDPSSVTKINNWIAEKTNNKIPKIIDNISPGDLMYIINAIYFNGAWKYAFNPSNTSNGIFYLQDGSSKSVPFMNQKLTTKKYTDSLISMIELPYGGGKSFSMYILKPVDQLKPLNTFCASLNQDYLQNAISKMDSATFQLQMPKWEYSYKIENMKSELAQLGMGISFAADADFSKLYDPSQVKPFISKAIHKTYIKVSEEGTEAAAVTAIGMEVTAAPIFNVFNLDHPFLYIIIEKQTGAILFLGTVNDPGINDN